MRIYSVSLRHFMKSCTRYNNALQTASFAHTQLAVHGPEESTSSSEVRQRAGPALPQTNTPSLLLVPVAG